MRNTKWMRAAGLLGLGLIMAGCATSRVYRMYEGQPLPNDKIARLSVPNAIDVYSIDGKVVYDFMLKAGKSEVQLLPGQHNIVARYNAVWNEGMESHEAVKSGLVGMSFEARAGHLYRIAFLEPQDVENAEKFAANVKLWIEDIQPGTPPATGRNGSLVEPVSVITSAPVAETSTAVSLSAPAPVAPKPETESLSLQNLKFWWRKAGEQERGQFREWLTENPAP